MNKKEVDLEIRSAVPELVTDNIGNTVEFYTKILGLKLISEYPKKIRNG